MAHPYSVSRYLLGSWYMQGAMLGPMNIETIKSDTIPDHVELNLQF